MILITLLTLVWKNPVLPEGGGAETATNGEQTYTSRTIEGRERNQTKADEQKESGKLFSNLYHYLKKRSYPADPEEARRALVEDLKTISEAKLDIRTQNEMYYHLAIAFSGDTFSLRGNPEDLVKRMAVFAEEYRKVDTDMKNRLVDNGFSDLGNRLSKLSPGEIEIIYNGLSQGNDGGDIVTKKLQGNMVAAKIISSDTSPVKETITGIEDPIVRRETERALLLGEFHSDVNRYEDIARFYLSDESLIEPSRDVSVKLFGAELMKNPEGLSKVIRESSPGEKRDLAIEVMVSRILSTDPENALLWIDQIENQDVKRTLASDPRLPDSR